MSLFQAAAAVMRKKAGVEAPKGEDTGLPFNARVGGLITLNISPFVRAHGTLLRSPGAVHTIVAISKMHIGLEGNVYRFYIEKGDSATDRESYVQVYVDSKKTVQEVLYFDRLLRMFPENADDLAAFTGKVEAGLGQLEFSLWKAQLAEIGYDESVLGIAFGDAESIAYTRMTPSQSDYMAPFEGRENRIDDSKGEQGLRQKIVFMPYERTLPLGGKEQLFISTEMVQDQNGKDSDSVHVDFMLGLPLSEIDVKVQ